MVQINSLGVPFIKLVDQRTPGPVCRTGPAARSGFGPETGPFTAGPDRTGITQRRNKSLLNTLLTLAALLLS